MVQSVSVEDHRKRLEALRDKLALALESCSENMLPQLAGQYRATLADLAALPAEVAKVLSVRDQLKERRESKHGDAAGIAEAATVSVAGRSGGKRGS